MWVGIVVLSSCRSKYGSLLPGPVSAPLNNINLADLSLNIENIKQITNIIAPQCLDPSIFNSLLVPQSSEFDQIFIVSIPGGTHEIVLAKVVTTV